MQRICLLVELRIHQDRCMAARKKNAAEQAPGTKREALRSSRRAKGAREEVRGMAMSRKVFAPVRIRRTVT